MSFQACLGNIKAKTGKTLDEFSRPGEEKEARGNRGNVPLQP